jgi:O-antigen/teichoic acid export membrane protein
MGALERPGGVGEHDAEDSSKLRFLLRSAASLASTTMVTAGLGFVFWAVAARAFPASTVGESSTAISAMGLLAPLSVLGFGTLVMVRLPVMREGRSTLVSTVTVVCGAVASLAALACALLLPDALLGLPGVGSRPVATVVFVGLVATQAVGNLLDQALLAAHGGGIQLGRNIIQAVTKLVLLGVVALTLTRFGSLNIVASWFLANAISIAAVVVVLMRRYRVSLRRALPDFAVLRGMQFDAARHHGLNTSLMLPYFAIPIVANAVLGSEQAAYLYASWSLAGFVFFLPVALATALFASGARDSRSFIMEFRFTLRFALLICLAANLVIVVFGGLVLGIFGKAYAQNGHLVLIVLAVGSLGTVIKDHHVTLARVVGNEGREAVLMAVLGAGEIGGAAVGAHHGGLVGLGLGWLAAVGVEVLVCGPLVWRAYRGRVAVPARSEPGAVAQ